MDTRSGTPPERLEADPTGCWSGRPHHTGNVRVGLLYLAAGVVLAAICAALWPWGAALLWPLLAVVVVAGAYFAFGPAIYGKHEGRVGLVSRLLLAPVIAGQHLSWRHYQHRCDPWNEVAPDVWIGRWLRDTEACAAVGAGVVAVLDVSDAFTEAAPLRQLAYKHLPVLDLTAPTLDQLDEAVRFIEQQRTRGIVYVHCKIGYSRSVAVVAAWLLATARASDVNDAIAQVRAVRPSIVVRPEIWHVLRRYHERHVSMASAAGVRAGEQPDRPSHELGETPL